MRVRADFTGELLAGLGQHAYALSVLSLEFQETTPHNPTKKGAHDFRARFVLLYGPRAVSGINMVRSYVDDEYTKKTSLWPITQKNPLLLTTKSTKS